MMMSELEMKRYYEKHGLSNSAVAYIEETKKDPSRLVGTRTKGNVCTDLVSQKCGYTIQTESRLVENPFVLKKELEKTALMIFDQTPVVMVKKTTKNGVKRMYSYTADFLILDDEVGPYIVETKSEGELKKLHKDNPDDWKFENSEYFYKPAKDVYENLGLRYVVVSDTGVSPILVENLRLLIYARDSGYKLITEKKERILDAFNERSYLRMSELLELINSSDTTPIFVMLLNEVLYADIDNELLSCPESVWLSPFKELLYIARSEEEIKNKDNPLLKEELKFDASKVPNKKQAKRVLKRLERVENNEDCSTIRKFRKKIKDGKEKGLNPFDSLMDNSHKQGNYNCKIPQVVKRTLINYINGEYATPKRLIKKSAYVIYKSIAKKIHKEFKPVSRNTFNKYRRNENQVEIAQGRGGRRAANAAKEPTEVQKREIRGTLPFMFATLDHYLADIFLIVAIANGMIYAFRPWFSALVDYATGHTLAYWFSFRSPSSRSCAMVLRGCVRKWGMLPNEILVDGGKDMDSIFFRALLAKCKVSRVLRPAEDPRFGGEGERSFGMLKTRCLSLLPGNIVEYVENRSISKSHAAEKVARMTILDLVKQSRIYYENESNSLIGDSMYCPSIQLKQSFEKYPFVGKKHKYDENFIINSAVTVKNYTVDPARGIHIDDRHFWNPALKAITSKSMLPETRIEPEDPYKIYTNINGRWVTCLAPGEQKFLSQDPDIRSAESIRINDGRKFRDAIKEESDLLLVDEVLKNEPEDIDKTKLYLPQKEIVIPQERHNDSLFNQTKNIELDPLETCSW